MRFATVSEAPKGVPLLELAPSSTRSPAASLRRFGEDRLVREAVRVAGDLPAAVARETRLVKVRSYDDISLELSDGRTVAWGSGENGRREGPGAHRSHESRSRAPALRRQRSHRPCVIRELTRIRAGQHPGWAALWLIT